MKKAIVLCSGGIDSVTTAYRVKEELGYEDITLLFFNYGQRPLAHERACSQACARSLGASFQEISLPGLDKLSFSLLNKPGIPKDLSSSSLNDTSEESARFYVPARNTIFLSYALALAESMAHGGNEVPDTQRTARNNSRGLRNPEVSDGPSGIFNPRGDQEHEENTLSVPDVFVGFKNEGQEHYPDTTHAYLDQFNKLAHHASLTPALVHAPLIALDKEEIIQLGVKLLVPLRNTFSCYNPPSNSPIEKVHCGLCLSCRLRKEGFKWAGVIDPTVYLKP